MANRSTAARMARLVARWRESGETGAGFARRHRIRPWVLWYWSRKLAEAPRLTTGPIAASPFVPVRVVTEDVASIEIVLANGDRVQVRAGASVDQVRAVVAALRGPC